MGRSPAASAEEWAATLTRCVGLTGVNFRPPPRADRPPGRLRLLTVGTAVVGGSRHGQAGILYPWPVGKVVQRLAGKSYRPPPSPGRKFSMSSPIRIATHDRPALRLPLRPRGRSAGSLVPPRRTWRAGTVRPSGQVSEIWRDTVPPPDQVPQDSATLSRRRAAAQSAPPPPPVPC